MDQIKNRTESLKGSEIEKFFKGSEGAVWAIKEEGNELQCGGVCVHTSGVIISVALLATKPEIKTLKGWCMALKEFVPLDVVSVDRKRNLSMLRIRDNLSSTSAVKYECLVLSNDEGVISGQKAITLVPSTGVKLGKPIRFHAEGVVAFPSGSESLAQQAKIKDVHEFFKEQVVHPYRTAEHIIAEWRVKHKAKRRGEHPLLSENAGFIKDIAAAEHIGKMITNLDSDLPLTDIMNIPSWSSDAFGCPVLDNSGNIIGLVALSQWNHTYALTIETLKGFCEEKKTFNGVDIVLSDNIMKVSKSA